MGIDTSAVIVVGYTCDEIESKYEDYLANFDEDSEGYTDGTPLDFYDWRYYYDLDSVSPYYDASKDDCLYGRIVYVSGDYSYSKFNIDVDGIKEVVQILKNELGIEPKVYLSAYVS